mmetsp:Transcript_9880/g.13755  ORF Transcript_9880/g.13755 Transcript_9880/m.13755 type:complete len:101 (-) Transcript_9880:401-703(-)|eukprot:CAMPEP_0184487598 /NCGR_PEP_ID=MMETSP0113_2-20130426/10216_1 /TAXON_ID=91329 /ORGANISM="Norrisiella sphaerica, Strain BC52" /LENGTH=100 /DNA_ID=CAMNT_0026869957 /DNA_START=76 /DNA_END=378 /DNA_ORIENTATION=+
MEFKQDMPPKGGFPRIKWKRNIPKSRFNGLMIYAGFFAITGYGVWRLVTGNRAETEKRKQICAERTKKLNDLQEKTNYEAFIQIRKTLNDDLTSSGVGHH